MSTDAERERAIRAVLAAAERVRDGRYSIATTLDRKDRMLFDDLNAAVDAYRASKAPT